MSTFEEALSAYTHRDGQGNGSGELAAIGGLVRVTDDNIDEILDRVAGHPSGRSFVNTVTGASAPDEPWGSPESLGYAADPLPFPVDALPGTLGEFVTAVAEASQTPLDLAGTLALSVLATVAGGRLRVVVRPGWDEPLNLYAAVALPPASRKSTVFRALTVPIRDRERDLVRDAQPTIRAALEMRSIADDAADKARKAAMSTASAAEREKKTDDAIRAREEADAVEVPPEPRLLVDDATPEALASLLTVHRRIAVLSDEGGIFDQMAGRYSGQTFLDVYLKPWDGSSLRVDRKGRPAELVEHPALTIGLAVQPQVLKALGDRADFAGRGLLGRFLFALPTPNIGHRKTAPTPVSPVLESAYSRLIRTLADRLDAMPEHARLFFDGEADAAMRRFEESLEGRLGEAGDLGHIASWGGKLAGTMARVAALLHLASVDAPLDHPISAGTVHQALRLGDYFIAHALAAFDLMWLDPKLADANRILEWIRRRESSEEPFTLRNAHRALQGRFRTAGECLPGLELLERKGYVRRVAVAPSGPGRPKGATYMVNPMTK